MMKSRGQIFTAKEIVPFIYKATSLGCKSVVEQLSKVMYPYLALIFAPYLAARMILPFVPDAESLVKLKTLRTQPAN